MEVKGQPAGVSCLLPLCRAWTSNLGHQAWQWALLISKPSHQPAFHFHWPVIIVYKYGYTVIVCLWCWKLNQVPLPGRQVYHSATSPAFPFMGRGLAV